MFLLQRLNLAALRVVCLSALCLGYSSQFAIASDVWARDWSRASAVAEREQRDVLVLFSGSDWNGWGKRFRQEVLEQPAFLDHVRKAFICVELDYPKTASARLRVLDAELNRKLRIQYGVHSFPTVILLTAQGWPYARIQYEDGGAEAFLKQIESYQQQRQWLVMLSESELKQQPKLLQKALPRLVEDDLASLPRFKKLYVEGLKQDVAGALGIRAAIAEQQALERIRTHWAAKKWAKMKKRLLAWSTVKDERWLRAGVACAQGLEQKNSVAEALLLWQSLAECSLAKNRVATSSYFREQIERCQAVLQK